MERDKLAMQVESLEESLRSATVSDHRNEIRSRNQVAHGLYAGGSVRNPYSSTNLPIAKLENYRVEKMINAHDKPISRWVHMLCNKLTIKRPCASKEDGIADYIG